jgi:hypothetical protein
MDESGYLKVSGSEAPYKNPVYTTDMRVTPTESYDVNASSSPGLHVETANAASVGKRVATTNTKKIFLGGIVSAKSPMQRHIVDTSTHTDSYTHTQHTHTHTHTHCHTHTVCHSLCSLKCLLFSLPDCRPCHCRYHRCRQRDWIGQERRRQG